MTALRKETLKNWIKALKVSKKYLAKDSIEDMLNINKSRYICCSIDMASVDGEVDPDVCMDLQDFIEDALNYNTFDNWLVRQGVNRGDFGENDEHLQAHRLAWMNRMIDEFKQELKVLNASC